MELMHEWEHAKGPCHIATYNVGSSYILSGGQDRLIRLVNADSGTLVNTYAGHAYEVLGIAVAADNSRFGSCGGDRSVMYWDVPTSTIIKRFSGHTSRCNAVAFNAESTVLASASFDASVRLWDLRSQQGKPIQVLQDAKDSITSVILGREEIVTGSVDGSVRTYDLRMGMLRTDYYDHPVTSISLTADSSTLLLSCLNSTLHLIDRSDGTLLQSYSGHANTSYRIHSCFGDSSEKTVLAGDEAGYLYQWDLAEGTLLKKEKVGEKSVLWTERSTKEDGKIVTASADGKVKIWRLKG